MILVLEDDVRLALLTDVALSFSLRSLVLIRQIQRGLVANHYLLRLILPEPGKRSPSASVTIAGRTP